VAEKASKKTAAPASDRTGDRPRLLLLDGHSLAYRAFFALPAENFSTTSGQTTNAIYGFTSMLANTLRDEQPTHLAVAFDVSRKTWRSEQFAEYKANRSKSPDEFKGQVELIGELLDTMNVTRFAVDGFEADDVIATLAAQAEAEGFEVLIVTGDRDSFQLVSDHVTVLYPTKGVSELTRFTPEKVQEKYGLTPRQYPDFAALRGDPSDNLPGIPGVGEKTAAKWINQFGSFQELVERVDEVKGKVGEKLRDHLESVKLNRQLTELVRDVELGVGPDGLKRIPYDRDALAVILDALEFRHQNFRDRILAVDPGAAEEEPAAAAPGVEVDGVRLGAGELAPWLADRGAEPLGLATVDTWALGSGSVSEVALATAGGPAVCFDPSELDEADERAFAAWTADPDRPKVLHNAKGTMRVFAEHGWSVAGVSMDTALAAYLVKPGRRSFELDALSVEYLGRELSPAAAADSGQLAFGADEQAEQDALMIKARTVLDLGEAFRGRLEEVGAAGLLSDVELPTSELLARLDEFNLGSPKQLQEVLFDELGLPKTKKIKTGYTTDADALQACSSRPHPFSSTCCATATSPSSSPPSTGCSSRSPTTAASTPRSTRPSRRPAGCPHRPEPAEHPDPHRGGPADPPRRSSSARAYESLMTADYSQIEMRIMAHLSGTRR
jgi:DNA polymerase-1